MLNKCIVAGIIFLLIGAGVLPTISGNNLESKYINDEFDENKLPIISGNLKIDYKAKSAAPTCTENPMFDVYDIQEFGQTAWGATCADFNDDGAVDFAIASATCLFTHSTISIFYNDGNLEFIQDDVYDLIY